jgi:SAM-dependent methyltransferase
VEDYRDLNRANWDERAPAHARSDEYALQRFRDDPAFISKVVGFDLPRLGDISGLTGIHLQCHIGTDTISLSRLGARMTGLDFSPASIAQARRLAADTASDVVFVEADVYDAPSAVDGAVFDFVFTGVGALCWLPDIRRWAAVVASLLRPGGRLFVREGHPMLWALDDVRSDGLLTVEYPYFERPEPLVWDEAGTYVETDVAEFAHTTTHSWNHGLGETVDALLGQGLEITGLVEHDTVPWEALPGLMHRVDSGEWQLADRPWRVPMTYTLQAQRRP